MDAVDHIFVRTEEHVLNYVMTSSASLNANAVRKSLEKLVNIGSNFHVLNMLSGILGPGLYPIQPANGDQKHVFCDTDSEPGMVWTLIESFAFAIKDKFALMSFSKDFPSNDGKFNWTDYRLPLSVMQQIRSQATHWRATCNYDSDGLVKRDYIRGLLSDTDILTYVGGHKCARVEYVNVRGMSCDDCTSHLRQNRNIHAFIDSYTGSLLGCGSNTVQGSVSAGGNYCENFGFYKLSNPAHRCTASPRLHPQRNGGLEQLCDQ
jgi:hypothetical protein